MTTTTAALSVKDIETMSAPTIPLKDGARALGVDPRTLLRAIDEGTVPGIRVGRRVVIPRLPFLRMLTGEDQTTAA